MINFLTKFQNFSQSFGLVENRFNQLCKTAHEQPPILACFKPEYIMACSHLLEGTYRPPLGYEFSFGLKESEVVGNVGLVSMVWFVGF